METLLTPDGPLSQEELDRATNDPEAAEYWKAFNQTYGLLYTMSGNIAEYFDPAKSLERLTPTAIEECYQSMLVAKQCQIRLRLAGEKLLSANFKRRNQNFMHAQRAMVDELMQQAERGMGYIVEAVKSMEQYRDIK